jgi:hypothetical protein
MDSIFIHDTVPYEPREEMKLVALIHFQQGVKLVGKSSVSERKLAKRYNFLPPS